MHVLAHDVRPPSALVGRHFDRQVFVIGALVSMAAHVAVPLTIAFGIALLASAGAGANRPETFIDEHVVEPRFVRLGKKPDPKKLPNREVPRLNTAPDQRTAISKEPNPPPPEERDAGVRPENPVDDLLTRLGDRAQVFAEIDDREREGDPEGLAEGTETQGQAGDIYVGQLAAFFKRGWTIPTTLGDTSVLVVLAEVEITVDLHVGDFRLVQRSGVAMFDQSVEDRFEQLRTLGTTLPEPPADVADRFLGKTIPVRFEGKRAE